VAIVHGHSSHHPKAIEVYQNRLILYGCGDFLNDYEGISGYEQFRDDLAVMYFADADRTSGDLVSLEMLPLQISRFRLNKISEKDAAWLHRTLDDECQKLGTRLQRAGRERLSLSWPGGVRGPSVRQPLPPYDG
jgi:poly-gamma-glutamate synthesis protein (capsule biosynthesis protein)